MDRLNLYKDRYIVTRLGEVFNIKTNNPVKIHIGRGGYPAVVLKGNDGKQHHEYLHRLLAETYLPNPDDLPCINHKDENYLNCSLDNLEWCTYQYNNTYNDRHIKAGKKLKGHPAPNKGVPMNDEQKKKISDSCKDRKFQGNQYIKL